MGNILAPAPAKPAKQEEPVGPKTQEKQPEQKSEATECPKEEYNNSQVGLLSTQPATKIVFNAPYEEKHTYHIKLENCSSRRVAWTVKSTNLKFLGADLGCGVLDPKEATTLDVACKDFIYGIDDASDGRITIEWTNTPDGADKQFRRDWFKGPVASKDLPIEYNV